MNSYFITLYVEKKNYFLIPCKVKFEAVDGTSFSLTRLTSPDTNEVSTHQPKQNFRGVNIIKISYGRIGP